MGEIPDFDKIPVEPKSLTEFKSKVNLYIGTLRKPEIMRILGVDPFNCKTLDDLPESQRADFLKALESEVDKKNTWPLPSTHYITGWAVK